MSFDEHQEGETPMTDYQFQQYEKLRDERDALKQELDLLKSQNFKSGETGMTDSQFKSIMETLYQNMKAMFDKGMSPEDILKSVAALTEDKTN